MKARTLIHALVVLVVAALALLVPRDARAAGKLQVMTPSIEEKAGEWHVRVRIDLPKPPPTLHMSMRFKFVKTMVYERAIMEKGKDPVLNKQSLANPPNTIVQQLVDFADAMGKVHNATIFEFEVKRASGFFEAGEFELTVIGPDGDVGSPQKIVLKGDNPPVYRGAISFDGPSNKMQNVASGVDGGKKTDDTPSANPTATDVAAVGTAAAMVPNEAFQKTPEEEIRDRPKGCGCYVAESAGPLSSLFAIGLSAAGLGIVFVRRRRR
jgi:MYXO-CTERM domain-containing protein